MYNLNKHNRALDVDTVASLAPSIMTRKPFEGLSDRYQPYPTVDFIRDIAKQGWYPVTAVEVRVKNGNRAGFQKHMIRFEHPECKLNDKEFLQLLIVNSTDGRCAYQASLGIWRCVCSNGMIVGDSFCQSPKIRHLGHKYQDIIDVSSQVLSQAPAIASNMGAMKDILLTQDERDAFAFAVSDLIVDDDKTIPPYQILRPRRIEDKSIENTLWGTLNIAQENVIKGNIRVIEKDAPRWARGKKKRAVKSIDKDVKLNKALWTLAEKMKEIKLA